MAKQMQPTEHVPKVCIVSFNSIIWYRRLLNINLQNTIVNQIHNFFHNYFPYIWTALVNKNQPR